MTTIPSLLLALLSLKSPCLVDKDNILSLETWQLSERIQDRSLSCVELMEATIERIDQVNSDHNALISMMDSNLLLDRAKIMDKLLDNNQSMGWLHGIPTAVKDLCDAKGFPKSMGGSPLCDEAPPADQSEPYINQLEKAGAIVIGKTNTPEYGLGSHTFNKRFGTTLNPRDPSKSAGGSSGGAAVAVATHMLCFADGTDVMGSLRNPAGWNGIYSHRPTAGLLDDNPPTNSVLSYPIGTAGPMARSPLDLAKLLETMIQDDSNFSSGDIREHLNAVSSTESLTIGWLGDWGGSYPMEDGVLETCEGALDQILTTLGMNVEDLVSTELYPADQMWTNWNRLRFVATADKFEGALDDDIVRLKPDLQWEIEQGRKVSRADLIEAAETASDYSQELGKYFGRIEILALPSAQLFPFPAEWDWPRSIADKDMDTYHRWMEVCIPASLAGLPCTTIPAGIGSKSGLPMGLTLFGPRGKDMKLLQVANTITDCMQ